MLPSNINRVRRHNPPNNHKEEVLMKVSMNDMIKIKPNKIGDEFFKKFLEILRSFLKKILMVTPK